ncbi:MAG: BMC domain-containing protein [Fidelibacterota bacterium]
MKKYPALALIEFSTIAAGIQAGDWMVKQAPISILKSGTVHQGKYLILIGGSVAAVQESYQIGLESGGSSILDRLFLPDVHEQVFDGIMNTRQPCVDEALGVIETSSVAATIQGADAGVKGARVTLVEIRLADDLGGKAFALFSGKVEEVEVAVAIARNNITDEQFWVSSTILPNIHSELVKQIDQSTSFAAVKLQNLEGGEL